MTYRLRKSQSVYLALFGAARVGIVSGLLYSSISSGFVVGGVGLGAMLAVGLPFLAWALLLMPTRVETDETGLCFCRGGRTVRVAWTELAAVKMIRFGNPSRPWLRWVSTGSTVWTSGAFKRVDDLLREVTAHAPDADPP